MKLNGWQRLGIAASVAWLPIGTYLGSQRVLDRADAVAAAVGLVCKENTMRWKLKADPKQGQPWASELLAGAIEDEKQCAREADDDYKRVIGHRWQVAAFGAVAPLPIAWFLVFGLIALFRWTRAGFR